MVISEQRPFQRVPGDDGRKVIHIDMDSFFASVEQRDTPEYAGRPLIVGGARERGVVAAASYEARAFGIRSAMPSVIALRKCPDLIVVRPRFDAYREVSRQIHEIFARYTDIVEPMSLDEAYLDVTVNKKNMKSATLIAEEIRSAIFKETRLTASSGISYCKWCAKMASDQNKPNGIFVIKPQDGVAFIEKLPISKFHGIGPAGAAKMAALGVTTGADLKKHSLEFLKAHFGKAGAYFFNLARGIDDRPVNPSRERKSIGKETTFSIDTTNTHELLASIQDLSNSVWRVAFDKNLLGKTVTLKVKFSDFEQITRQLTSGHAISKSDDIFGAAERLLHGIMPLKNKVRLVGVTISGFGDNQTSNQLELDIL